jgi:hypothetical protein
MNPSSVRWRLIAGGLLLLIPLFLLGLWIYACQLTPGYPQNQQLYFSWLPKLLRSKLAPALVSLPFCIIALKLNLHKISNGTIAEPLRLVILFTAMALISLNLFSIM